MAKFASGKETTKFDKMTEAAVVQELADLKEQVSQYYHRSKSDYAQYTQECTSKYEAATKLYQESYHKIDGRISNIECHAIAMFARLLTSPAGRFLNFFFHWYHIMLMQVNYTDEYVGIIVPYAKNITMHSSGRDTIKADRRLYKKHLRQIHEKGIKTREINFRF